MDNSDIFDEADLLAIANDDDDDDNDDDNNTTNTDDASSPQFPTGILSIQTLSTILNNDDNGRGGDGDGNARNDGRDGRDVIAAATRRDQPQNAEKEQKKEKELIQPGPRLFDGKNENLHDVMHSINKQEIEMDVDHNRELDFGFELESPSKTYTEINSNNKNNLNVHMENRNFDEDGDDDSDDDDDDGFLTSWMETEKQFSSATSASSLSKPPIHPQYLPKTQNQSEDDNENDDKNSCDGKGVTPDGQTSPDSISGSITQRPKQDSNDGNYVALCKESVNEDVKSVFPVAPSKGTFKNECFYDHSRYESDDDGDDDENDVGFLETWSRREKNNTTPSFPTTTDEIASDDSRPDGQRMDTVTIEEEMKIETTNSTLESERVSTSKSTQMQKSQSEEMICNINVEIGESVIQWISNTKSSMRHDPKATRPGNRAISNNTKNAEKLLNYHEFGGVISIQQSRSKVNTYPSSLMRLSTSPTKNHKTGHPRTSKKASNVSQVILESIPPEGESASASETTQKMKTIQSGQASLAPNPESTLPGTMVDCLAIYDSKRGCYILEIVDLTVSKLRVVSNKAAVANSKPSVESSNNDDAVVKETTMNITIPDAAVPQPTLIDPRSRAKRAEDQIRRLKRLKGKQSGMTAKISKKRQKVESSRGKDENAEKLISS
ncbi:hypothetical protein ACHAXS_012705 [Conticribra weissflogii]